MLEKTKKQRGLKRYQAGELLPYDEGLQGINLLALREGRERNFSLNSLFFPGKLMKRLERVDRRSGGKG